MQDRYTYDYSLDFKEAAQTPRGSTATLQNTGVDLKGYKSVVMWLDLAATTTAFTANNKLTVKVQHSDTAVAGDFEDVPVDQLLSGYTGSTAGVVREFTGAKNEQTTHKFGYVGGKRYIRVQLVGAGTTPQVAYNLRIVGSEPLAAPVPEQA